MWTTTRLTETEVPKLAPYAAPPGTEYILLEGTLEIPDSTPPHLRYDRSEVRMAGKLRVLVATRVRFAYGLEVYVPLTSEWWMETSHYASTLMNDPTFMSAYEAAGGTWESREEFLEGK